MKYAWIIALLMATNSSAQDINPKTGRHWELPNMDTVLAQSLDKPYVDFDVTTLDGKQINSATCKGKVTFLNFWFEGCQPCREEIGKLNELYDSLKGNPNIVFVAITFDAPESLPDFIRKTGIKYPVATVNSKVESKRLNYGMGYPGSIILDKKGIVRSIFMKGIADKPDAYKTTVPAVLATIAAAVNRQQ